MRRRLTRWAILLAIILLGALDHAGVFGYRPGERRRYHRVTATVTRVVDGATLEVDIPDGDRPVTSIRLRGIEQSSGGLDFLRSHVAGCSIRIHLDPHRKPRDDDGRILAYAYLEGDEVMLNERMILAGLARADAQSDHVYAVPFAQKENIARRGKLGLWSDAQSASSGPGRATAAP